VNIDFDIPAYLASKGHRGRPAGANEVTYACFFDCDEPSDSRKRKLYINPAEGVFNCFVCGAKGGVRALMERFGDEPRPEVSDDGYVRRRLLTAAADVGKQMLHNNDDVLSYLLEERGLDPETIEARRLGFAAPGWSLVGQLGTSDVNQLALTGLVHRDGDRRGRDFYYRHILIPYLSRGSVQQMRGRIWGESRGGKYMSGPGEEARLYNSDSLEGAEEVLITEGEFDAMVLAQHLGNAPDERANKIAVVGLAGIQTWPKDLMTDLADAKRIFIGFDSDEPGKVAAEKLKEEIGARARVVQLPNEDLACDWSDYMLPADGKDTDWRAAHPYAGHSWRDVLRLMGAASGKRIFSVREAGMRFREYRANNRGLQLGFAELDATIAPGMLPGQVVVFLAKTGTGKTLFLCNVCVNMREHPILFISLEMTQEEVYDRLAKIYWFHHPDATVDELEEALSNIFICDENRLGERDMPALIAEFEVETGVRPQVVMVDYLGYYARGARGNSPYEKASSAIMHLKAIAKAGRFVIITPSQVNRVAKDGKPIDLDDARDSGAVEETADFMFSLYRPDDALNTEGEAENNEVSGRVKCGVLKSRHGGKGRTFTFQMDMLTLAIVDDMTSDAGRAREHNDLLRSGADWASLRRAQTRPRQRHMEIA
jgi:archaellum biogenesis ATPase FlaH